MSFLSTNNSEILSARITQKGRNAIAKGHFNIEFFQIGDSEFDYNTLLSDLVGNKHQMVMSPFDKEAGIKYPYKIDSSASGTTYGVPINSTITESIRNVMGPAGFVSNYIDFDSDNCIGTTIKSEFTLDSIPFTSLTGGTTLSVVSGTTYKIGDTIILVLSDFCGTEPTITGNSTSLIYKIIDINNNVLEVDRKLPNISGLSGYGQIVKINSELEYPISGITTCLPRPIDPIDQHNAWSLEVVWGDQWPIGVNNNVNDSFLNDLNGNRFISTKELLGYTTSSGQTFTDVSGGTITYPTFYKNSFGESINVPSEEQRSIAIIHYSELGDIINDPERFFKYDDYISTNDVLEESLYTNEIDIPLTDEEYFEIYIPFIYYHRNSTGTFGALFHMDSTDYYIKSTLNSRHQLLFRYLIDESGNKVGKVFPNNKIVVFDDQELVAILDFRSNRRYTLGAPKVSLVHSDDTPSNSIFSGGTGQTMWISYMLSEADGWSDKYLNGLPCNYFSKVESTDTPSNVTVKFSGNTFQYMTDQFTGITHGYVCKRFYILAQLTNSNEYPNSESWSVIEFTTEAGGDGFNYINPTGMTGVTFVITKSLYENGDIFNIEDYMNNGYDTSTTTQFGSEQYFPGSIRLVRASDIEPLNFLINLPTTQFTTTQNPTYESGDKVVTEVALLDANKEVLATAKTATPIKRTGTQIFSLKIDF